MKSFPIQAFKDNYIWMLSNEQSPDVWVVDPGDAWPVISTLQEKKLTLAGILLTHHHADHSGGIVELVKHFGHIPVYGSHKSVIKSITHPVKDKDVINCGTLQFQVIEIPGHTLDHVAYYGNHSVFCGDTLFSAGCGKVFEGTAEQMYGSLQKLFHLDDNTKIYCGHEYTLANLNFAAHVEPENTYLSQKIISTQKLLAATGCTLPSVLQEEKRINPFLRCHDPAVIQAVEKQTGKKMRDAVQVFYYLREWKNNF